MSGINEEEYPNQFLGLQTVTGTHIGPSNRVAAPLKLDTGAIGNNGSNGPLGASLQSGVGVPNCGGEVGGLYFRTDTPSTSNQRIYICTVAGLAGAATWVGIL